MHLGILLMLATFVLGKNINGSKSWIPLGGGFNLQPAELCKIFTALALAKLLSRQETDFTKLKSQIIAGVIALTPAVLSIAQHEMGLALVYLTFFIVMYREGLPPDLLIIGFSFAVLVVATLLLEPNVLAHYFNRFGSNNHLFFKKANQTAEKIINHYYYHLGSLCRSSAFCSALYF
jgi:rod shape determining protein RodA